jgi:uncharacterized damage-inducible protein DinB
MLTPAQLTEAFARNISIVKMQAAGLSDADSLRQLPFRGNCLNWVLGHLVNNRDRILHTLGAAAVGGATVERYMRESEPVLAPAPDVLPLAELLRLLALSQEALAAALAAAPPEALSAPVPAGQRTATVAERIFFLYFHETYHVGQTELLRQLADKDDKII